MAAVKMLGISWNRSLYRVIVCPEGPKMSKVITYVGQQMVAEPPAIL
jgi:hypothetical protein